jgi:hypothetical protein
MDGDEVTTITETTESLSVAGIVEQCYYRIVSEFQLPEQQDAVTLDEDATAPVLMSPNPNVLDLFWVKYNVGTVALPNYVDIPYVDNKTFFDIQLKLNPVNGVVYSSFNYTAIAGSSLPIIYGRMAHPTFYTVLQDKKLVFNSYDSSTSARILEGNTFAFGQLSFTWTRADAFIPPLDGKLHQLLFEMARDQAHVDLKQVTNENAKMAMKKAKITARKEPLDLGKSDYYYDSNQLPTHYGRK